MDRGGEHPSTTAIAEAPVMQQGIERQQSDILAFSDAVDKEIASIQDVMEEWRVRAELGATEVIARAKPLTKLLTLNIKNYLSNLETISEGQEIAFLRLSFIAETVEEHTFWIVLAKYGRDDNEARGIRAELSQSLYGFCANRLEQLLHDNAKMRPVFSDEARKGAINEFTALALLNKKASANRIALLTPAYVDHLLKVDIELFAFDRDPRLLYRKDIQVKSSAVSDVTKAENPDTYFITARDMRNNGTRANFYLMSRAIVLDNDGRGNTRTDGMLTSVLDSPLFRSITTSKEHPGILAFNPVVQKP